MFPRKQQLAPRAGSDLTTHFFVKLLREFQSTLPVRGATRPTWRTCAGRLISIHAPRAGSDDANGGEVMRRINFNPRSPCGERPVLAKAASFVGTFQSTLPVRGATRHSFASLAYHLDFNPRSPCGERQHDYCKYIGKQMISIHAPRAGSDARQRINLKHSWQFQSTLPVRGATVFQSVCVVIKSISIHAPRAGSDAEKGRGALD